MEKLIETLKQKGYTDEQIRGILELAQKAAQEKLNAEIMLSLTDEDFKSIDEASDEESNAEIAYFYKLRTGKTVEESMKIFYDDFAKGFLAEMEKNPGGVN